MINYGSILIFCILGVLMSLALIAIPFAIAPFRPYRDKLSTYECGITPLGDAKQPFDIQFYLVAILFIIFDLEIVLLLPWAAGIKHLGCIGMISAIGLIAILTLGLLYEWKSGALDW